MRFAFEGFVLEVGQRRLFAGIEEIRLQPKAFDLLRLLIDARPKALSKDDILAAVWPGTYVSENSLATVVRDLRAVLGDDAQDPRFIRTAYGYGYAFVAQATRVTEPAIAAGYSAWSLLHDHREIRLREGDNVLGRAGHEVIVFDSPTVSRHHARVRISGTQVTVEDLNSKNGTWLGMAQVKGPVPLAAGAELRLGSVVVHVRHVRNVPTTETVRQDGLHDDSRPA